MPRCLANNLFPNLIPKDVKNVRRYSSNCSLRRRCIQQKTLMLVLWLHADVLKMTIWQTPAGIVDEGGVVLESWLNFGITLMGPPANGVMHVSNLQNIQDGLPACRAQLYQHASCEMIACMPD